MNPAPGEPSATTHPPPNVSLTNPSRGLSFVKTPRSLAALGHPSFPSNLRPSPGQTNPTWEQVFGSDADEYFHAWSVASFIGQVAAAGKAEYPLPQYVNAALRDPLTHPAANTYESGGPSY